MKMNHRSLSLPHPCPPGSRPTLAISALALALALAGCSGGSSGTSTLNDKAVANAGNFTRTVFLGDSLTAGYQSGSLLDTQQVHGYANLVATQAAFPIALPLIAYPGAPSVIQLVKVGPPPVTTTASGTTSGRDDFGLQPTDLAVPGAYVNDVANTLPLLTPTTPQQQINQLVLGYPGFGFGTAYSQAQQAIAANPTTIFLWIGNNDALVADLTGMPSSMTTTANFTTQYQSLIQLLTTKTNAHLVLGNIPDVTLVPYLQPAALILAEYSAATGYPIASLSALLGITTGDFVTPAGLSQIPLILTGQQKTPISDAGVLSAAEVVTVKAQVAAFNTVIAAQATASGATLVDINALFNSLAANGLTVGGYTGTNSFLGGFFSLDGIHPTNTGYAVVANKFIDSLNAAVGSKIPDVNLIPIAAADPLWPPNLPKP
jgi:lysophospholipase L1-like esterase